MRPSLTDQASLRAFLAGHKLRPNKKSSQNFLICQEVIEAVLLALTDGPPSITELGAGVGTLTQALAGAGFFVRAIESDQRLAATLPRALTPKERERVEVIAQDMRKVEWHWPQGTHYQLVGNIPYHLSGLIIRQITALAPVPDRVVLLTQREVGERLCAQPGDMQLLGLAVQLWGSAYPLLQVPANCFWPEPKVDSQLTLLVPHEKVRHMLKENERVMTIARPLFQARRKQLGGQIARTFHLERSRVQDILHSLGLDPTQRPQELTVTQWRQLAQTIHTP